MCKEKYSRKTKGAMSRGKSQKRLIYMQLSCESASFGKAVLHYLIYLICFDIKGGWRISKCILGEDRGRTEKHSWLPLQ